MTCSWHGASLWEISTGLSGCDSACASFFTRSASSFQPNMRLMIVMSPNRLVMTRWFGLPLTLLNRIGQPPSMCFCRPVTSRSGLTGLSVSIRSPCWRNQSSVLRRSEGCCSRAGLSFSLRMDFCIVELPLLRGCGSAQLQLLWFCARLHRFYSYMGRVSNPPLHGPMAAELFVIAHAAALAADAGDVGFLGNGFRGARLRETVVHGGHSSFLDLIKEPLSQRIVLHLERPHVGTHDARIRMCRELSVGDVETEDVEVAVAELLVLFVIEFGERRGFVALELGHRTIEHRPRLRCGPELLRQRDDRAPHQRHCRQSSRKYILVHGVSPFDVR